MKWQEIQMNWRWNEVANQPFHAIFIFISLVLSLVALEKKTLKIAWYGGCCHETGTTWCDSGLPNFFSLFSRNLWLERRGFERLKKKKNVKTIIKMENKNGNISKCATFLWKLSRIAVGVVVFWKSEELLCFFSTVFHYQ